MDILVVDAISPEVLDWIGARYPTRYAPELDRDPRALRQALFNVRALVIPGSVALDQQALQYAPVLRAVGRLGGGVESLDTEACARAGVEVVRANAASAAAEAEFCIMAMLQLLRRVPVRSNDGYWVGRELGACQVGIVGMTSAVKSLSKMLHGFGAQVGGYDPSIHATDGLWGRWGVTPLPLRDLVEKSDVLCVLMPFYPRYRGLLGERVLANSKDQQVVINLSHSDLFDEAVLSQALNSGRMAAAWFDSLEPGAQDPGRPLAGANHLQVTPRVASTTRESRNRAAWAVMRRIDELLGDSPRPASFKPTAPELPVDLAGEPSSE
jgi:D-3-phosphoglycerate dehydrogenase / 2-oxoglutarate reductase